MDKIAQIINSLTFDTPLYFYIGSVLVLIFLFFPFLKRRTRKIFFDLSYWKNKVSFKSKRVWVLSTIVVIISILLTGVLSQPYTAFAKSTEHLGKPVLAVVDVSGSMIAKPTIKAAGIPNYEKSRDTLENLIVQCPDVDFGFLLFSTESYIARYFAYKPDLLKDSIENADELYYFSKGTQILGALAKARQFLTKNINGDKAIVLISDIEVDLQTTVQMAEELNKEVWADIKVFIIAIGNEGNAAAFLTIPGVKMVDMNDQAGIAQISQELSDMKSSTILENKVSSAKSLIPYLIIPCLVLFIVCLILSEFRFRKIP
jgi:hypothetical protein